MASAAQQWDALGKLFEEDANRADQPYVQPKTSYGVDAPVSASISGPAPGKIGPQVAAAAKPKPKPKVADDNEIWDAEEVDEEPDEPDDGRPQPEYDIVYKQDVSSQDSFLGVDPLRHPGISCSDALILKVQLPGTKMPDIQLDVRPTYVRLLAPKFRLKAWLPAKVDETGGNAKWDGDKETLIVTLKIVPEDFGTKVSVSNELD